MEALKQFIEGELDIRSMPGFLEQVSGETGKSSGSYAISLFVEVARVHKEATVPFIPRIMAAVLRTLASLSGGAGHANNLHQACAKVVASVARYAIKPTSGVGRSISAADILDSLCRPLLGLLSSNVEPVAVGSATCLQAVIETENWKLAAPELVHDVCSSTPGCGSWQQRAAAAQLLGTMIGCVDSGALGLELVSTTKALENCHLDKVATVRQAVGEALSVAKSIASKVNPLLLHDGGSESNLVNSSPTKSRLHEPRKSGARKRNLSKAEELHGSTISANDIVVVSQESQCVSYASSPSSSITSVSSSSLRSPSPPPTEKLNVRIGRSPLYPAKQSPACPPSSIDKYMAETDVPYILANAKSSEFKENTPFVAKVEDGLGLVKPDDLSYLVYSNGNKIPKESDNDDLQQMWIVIILWGENM
ncbi:hypothetical protein L7F22_034591 [Adiantum nelumboides]|nr:hypothetical protein [Adiantum nelumboides]